jgi:hypothetical protein
MSNYMSVLLLTTFSEVHEKIIHNRLSHYFQTNNALVPEHFGFRKGTSTTIGAFNLTDSVLISIIQKMHVGGIFCDLAKAFDCVNQEILLSKLNFFNIQGATVSWIRCYLTDRK